jgi:phage gpG-like protein
MTSVEAETNAPEVAGKVNSYATRIGDPRPAFELMVRALRQSERETFSSSGAALGVSWPPAADPSRKTDSRLLVASGRLMNSLASMTGDSVAEVQTTSLRFGTDVPYASYLQYGTSRMPARPFLGMTDSVQSRLLTILNEQLERGGD